VLFIFKLKHAQLVDIQKVLWRVSDNYELACSTCNYAEYLIKSVRNGTYTSENGKACLPRSSSVTTIIRFYLL